MFSVLKREYIIIAFSQSNCTPLSKAIASLMLHKIPWKYIVGNINQQAGVLVFSRKA
jgi:hypothetical protein